MNLILINQIWFKNEWLEDGDKVFTVGLNFNFDLIIPRIIHINDILSQIPKGFGTPDAIVIFDNSSPLYILGLEDVSIPTYFYAVDTHHHNVLHAYLSDAFDATSIAMKDYLPFMQQKGNPNVDWLPLWTSRIVDVSEEKKYGAVFVGTLNKELNKERVEFFDTLKQKIDILCMQGDWWNIFPYSEIVINQTVKGDLNFRVFEAMGCGSLLLTEKTPNGLFDLFQDGVHLTTYTKNNVDEAKDKIEYFLNHKDEAHCIAMQGREEILAHHLPRHRAEVIKAKLKNLKKRNSNRKYIGMAANFSSFYLKHFNNNSFFFEKTLELAMAYLKLAVNRGEDFRADDTYLVFKICINYDFLFKSNEGEKLALRIKNNEISVASEVYQVWRLMNAGKFEEIGNVLKVPVNKNDIKQLFEKYNNFVCSFIEKSC